MLEVGSGWGYMPIYMAKKYGCDVTVYNPVKAQNDYMLERFKRQGVADRIRLYERDHREIVQEGADVRQIRHHRRAGTCRALVLP